MYTKFLRSVGMEKFCCGMRETMISPSHPEVLLWLSWMSSCQTQSLWRPRFHAARLQEENPWWKVHSSKNQEQLKNNLWYLDEAYVFKFQMCCMMILLHRLYARGVRWKVLLLEGADYYLESRFSRRQKPIVALMQVETKEGEESYDTTARKRALCRCGNNV